MLTIRYFTSSGLRKLVHFSLLAIFVFASSNIMKAQSGNYILSQQTKNENLNTYQDSTYSDKVVVLKLIDLSQYQQCVRMVFELENISGGFINNCWFHVSLQDSERGFLYREQPLLFAEVAIGGRQQLELLCESVGIEEVGYIILHPQLLEIERVETLANPSKVQVIPLPDSDVKVVFNSELR